MQCKWITSATALLLLFLPPFAAATDPGGNLIGRWYTKDNKAIFEFYRKGNDFCGRLEPLKLPHIIDSLNPVDSLKSRKLAGATTIWGLRFNPDKNQWENGFVYNPSDGRTYRCTCRLIDEGKHLRFRGYIGVSILGQSQVWRRVEEE